MNAQIKIESIEDALEILNNRRYTVRPSGEIVPKLFQGLLIGRLFEKLVRMNDGIFHEELKRDIVVTLSAFSQEEIQQAVKRIIVTSAFRIDSPETLTQAIYAWPILTMADQMGMKIKNHQQFVLDVTTFAAAMVNFESENLAILGNQALERLYELILPAQGPLKRQFIKVSSENKAIDIDSANLNLLGLFFQTLDGTSGLIGQMLQRLLDQPKETRDSCLKWVLRHQSPIQNTRRFDGAQCYRVSLQMNNQSLPFGSGAHECPGQLWAKTIALTIIDYLKRLPMNDHWLRHYCYKQSPNAKVVEFYSKSDEGNA